MFYFSVVKMLYCITHLYTLNGTVEARYNGILGTERFLLVSDVLLCQWSRGNTKKEKFLQIRIGEVGLLCQVFIIHVLDLFISRFHCITVHLFAVCTSIVYQAVARSFYHGGFML